MSRPPNLGTIVDLDDGNDDWPQAADIARDLKVTRKTVENWADGGRLIRYKSKANRIHYNPAEVEQVRRARASNPRLRGDMRDFDDEEDDQSPPPNRTVLDSPTAALLAQVYSHNHVIMQEYKLLVKETIENNRELRKYDRDRIRTLEAQQDSMLKAREEALDNAADRKALAEQMTREQARKDKALDELFRLAPQLLGARVASQFLSSITGEQLEMALAIGDEFWTAEQLRTLQSMKKAYDQKQAAKAKQDAEAGKSAPPETSEPPAAEKSQEPAPAASAADESPKTQRQGVASEAKPPVKAKAKRARSESTRKRKK